MGSETRLYLNFFFCERAIDMKPETQLKLLRKKIREGVIEVLVYGLVSPSTWNTLEELLRLSGNDDIIDEVEWLENDPLPRKEGYRLTIKQAGKLRDY